MKWEIRQGDVIERLREMPSESVQCVVTSPPYWGLRDYGVDGQIGLEKTPQEFLEKMTEVFREVRRVLKNDGTAFVNMGDCYAGSWGAQSRGDLSGKQENLSGGQIAAAQKRESGTGSLDRFPGLKPKDLVGMPWRLALALQADGWWLRSDIIWKKPNPMPESVTDRPTKSHEYLFLLAKSERYYYDADAIREANGFESDPQEYAKLDGRRTLHEAEMTKGMSERNPGFRSGYTNPKGRNKRTVWTIATEAYPEAHFATYPRALVEPCIKAGSKPGDLILDPFSGSGTTGQVALENGRDYIGIELNPEYIRLAEKRLRGVVGYQPELFGKAIK